MKILSVTVLGALLCACNFPAASKQPQTALDLRATSSAFDYYLLNLSWAPEFCYSKPNSPECGKGFGFIVHGLWPQYARGGYPENCGQQPGLANPSQMLDIMPDLHLIDHEWKTHGTCSGLSPNQYFGLLRQVFNSVKMPPDFVGTPRPLTKSPAEIKQEFQRLNPAIGSAGIALSCGGGGGAFLVAVEICVSKDGKPTQCGAGIRDCRSPSIRIPKVQ